MKSTQIREYSVDWTLQHWGSSPKITASNCDTAVTWHPRNVSHSDAVLLSIIKINLSLFLCGVWGWRPRAKGKAVLPLEYLTPYFGYFILPPRWLVGVMPCPRKSQKNYTKEKTATDNRRRRFFYTFLYLLGSTTIPWMREFFLNTLKWLNLPVKVSKYVHACVCPHFVFRACIRVSFLLELCQSLVRVSL